MGRHNKPWRYMGTNKWDTSRASGEKEERELECLYAKKNEDAIKKKVLNLNTQGKWRRGRPSITSRRLIEREVKPTGEKLERGQIVGIGQGQVVAFREALCSRQEWKDLNQISRDGKKFQYGNFNNIRFINEKEIVNYKFRLNPWEQHLINIFNTNFETI